MKKYRLVKIEWLDSTLGVSGWKKIDVLERSKSAVCISVGFLVCDKKEIKIIFPHLIEGDEWIEEQGAGEITIPTKAIISIRDLKTCRK